MQGLSSPLLYSGYGSGAVSSSTLSEDSMSVDDTPDTDSAAIAIDTNAR